MLYTEEMARANIRNRDGKRVFFLGKGFTNVKLEGRGSHSTPIQTFFQFGFIGVPVLIYWVPSGA